MRAWRSALVIGLVLVAAASSSTPDDYPRRIGIDIEHYRFELALADDSDEIAGRATVTVLFTGSGVVDLPLDLTSIASGGRGMEVLSVMSDGASLDGLGDA